MNLARLSEPFPQSAVHWRVQGKPFERSGTYSAMALAYLDARDVMDRLDEACGPENWQSLFEETPRGRVICKLGIRVGDDWVFKSDGAGDTDVEGEKGGISDALKRAAVSWGVGRYLYRLDSPWVACEVNDKGAWKRWKEDPWSKVKGAPKPAADATPAFNARAAADRIISWLNLSESIADLADRWKEQAEAIGDVKAASKPIFDEINRAKEARKAALQPKEKAA